jgi:hypothetical protein
MILEVYNPRKSIAFIPAERTAFTNSANFIHQLHSNQV